MSDLTRILHALNAGDPQAAAQLLPEVYEELRRLAAALLASEKPGQTLDPTALVHEAFLRLVGTPDGDNWANRRHFYAAAAQAMRRILVESARRKNRLKRGGQRQRQDIDLDGLLASEPDEDLLDLHEALEKLAEHDATKARLVELRFFAGLTLAEAASCLDISLSTADRYWRYARAWLYATISEIRSEKNMSD